MTLPAWAVEPEAALEAQAEVRAELETALDQAATDLLAGVADRALAGDPLGAAEAAGRWRGLLERAIASLETPDRLGVPLGVDARDEAVAALEAIRLPEHAVAQAAEAARYVAAKGLPAETLAPALDALLALDTPGYALTAGLFSRKRPAPRAGDPARRAQPPSGLLEALGLDAGAQAVGRAWAAEFADATQAAVGGIFRRAIDKVATALAGGRIRYKRWVTIHDDRVRPSHVAVDGQARPLDGTFLVGGHALRYPGDPLAPPEERINCRCAIVAVR